MKYSRWNWSLFGLFIPFFCSKKCQLKEISYQIKGVIFLLVCSSLILVWRWKVLKLGEGRVVSPCPPAPPRCRRVARITTRPHHILAELRSQGHLTLYYPPLSRDCHTLTTSLIKHFQNIFAIFWGISWIESFPALCVLGTKRFWHKPVQGSHMTVSAKNETSSNIFGKSFPQNIFALSGCDRVSSQQNN